MSNIVLVHGGFVDGSGWQGVYRLLRDAGHQVDVVQNPTKSLADDVAFTNRVLDQREKAILVGHSYGGAVITEAGNHPNVESLVYICAFAPDAGESVNTLLASAPADAPAPPILPPVEGFLLLDRGKFREAFAGDVDPETAEFMADSQVPWNVDALGGVVSEAAWSKKKSWYLRTSEDRMIAPRLQQTMSERAGATVVEVDASHAVYVSKPEPVAEIITSAIDG